MSPQPTDGSTPAPRVGRPYDHSRDAEILAVTLAALADEGYEHLTLDGVARRAGRAKTTLYRRWPTKLDLVVAAVRAAGPPPESRHLLDTGSLRDDLLALVDSPWLGGPGRRPAVLDGLAAAALVSDRLADAVRQTISAPYVEVHARLLRRALERGQVPAGVEDRLPLLAQLVPAWSGRRAGAAHGATGRDEVVAVIDGVLLPAVGWWERPRST